MKIPLNSKLVLKWLWVICFRSDISGRLPSNASNLNKTVRLKKKLLLLPEFWMLLVCWCRDRRCPWRKRQNGIYTFILKHFCILGLYRRHTICPWVDILLWTLFLSNHWSDLHKTSQKWLIPSLVVHIVTMLCWEFFSLSLICSITGVRVPPWGISSPSMIFLVVVFFTSVNSLVVN